MSNKRLFVLVSSGFFVFFVFAVLMMNREENKWNTFRIQHNCFVVRHVAATSGVGLSGDGSAVSVTIGEKTVWRCADGMEYERGE